MAEETKEDKPAAARVLRDNAAHFKATYERMDREFGTTNLVGFEEVNKVLLNVGYDEKLLTYLATRPPPTARWPRPDADEADDAAPRTVEACCATPLGLHLFLKFCAERGDAADAALVRAVATLDDSRNWDAARSVLVAHAPSPRGHVSRRTPAARDVDSPWRQSSRRTPAGAPARHSR